MYYIIQHGQLDITAMRKAASHFVGEHDFRNFCKLDLEHVKSFQRRILDFQINEVQPTGADGRALYVLHVKGTAFLWHQVSLNLMQYSDQRNTNLLCHCVTYCATSRALCNACQRHSILVASALYRAAICTAIPLIAKHKTDFLCTKVLHSTTRTSCINQAQADSQPERMHTPSHRPECGISIFCHWSSYPVWA